MHTKVRIVTEAMLLQKLVMSHGFDPKEAREVSDAMVKTLAEVKMIVEAIEEWVDLDGGKVERPMMEAIVDQLLKEVKIGDKNLFDLGFDMINLTELLTWK